MATARSLFVVVLLAACALPGRAEDGGRDVVAVPGFREGVRPLLARYCFGCHAGDEPEGGLTLAAFESEDDALRNPEAWQRVWSALRSREMPPEEPFPRVPTALEELERRR